MNKAGKVIALILAAVMIATLIPAAIFAEGAPAITEAAYDETSGKVTYTVSGVPEGSSLIVAGYEQSGRMISILAKNLKDPTGEVTPDGRPYAVRLFLTDGKNTPIAKNTVTLMVGKTFKAVLEQHLQTGLDQINAEMTGEGKPQYAKIEMDPAKPEATAVITDKTNASLLQVTTYFTTHRITSLDSLGEYVGTIQAGSGTPIPLNGGHVTRDQAMQLLKDSGLLNEAKDPFPDTSKMDTVAAQKAIGDYLAAFPLQDLIGQSCKITLTDQSGKGTPVVYDIIFTASKA